MKKLTICTLYCLCVVLMACGTARAQFWQTLSQTNGIPCGDTYVLENGLFVLGAHNTVSPGVHQDVAWPFVSLMTGTVAQVNLLLTQVAGDAPSGVAVGIWTSSCGGLGAPDRLLGRRKAKLASGINNTTHVNFAPAGINLTVGERYWVVVETNDADPQLNTTAAVWWAPMSSVYTIGNISAGDHETVSIVGPGGFAVTP